MNFKTTLILVFTAFTLLNVNGNGYCGKKPKKFIEQIREAKNETESRLNAYSYISALQQQDENSLKSFSAPKIICHDVLNISFNSLVQSNNAGRVPTKRIFVKQSFQRAELPVYKSSSGLFLFYQKNDIESELRIDDPYKDAPRYLGSWKIKLDLQPTEDHSDRSVWVIKSRPIGPICPTEISSKDWTYGYDFVSYHSWDYDSRHDCHYAKFAPLNVEVRPHVAEEFKVWESVFVSISERDRAKWEQRPLELCVALTKMFDDLNVAFANPIVDDRRSGVRLDMIGSSLSLDAAKKRQLGHGAIKTETIDAMELTAQEIEKYEDEIGLRGQKVLERQNLNDMMWDLQRVSGNINETLNEMKLRFKQYEQLIENGWPGGSVGRGKNILKKAHIVYIIAKFLDLENFLNFSQCNSFLHKNCARYLKNNDLDKFSSPEDYSMFAQVMLDVSNLRPRDDISLLEMVIDFPNIGLIPCQRVAVEKNDAVHYTFRGKLIFTFTFDGKFYRFKYMDFQDASFICRYETQEKVPRKKLRSKHKTVYDDVWEQRAAILINLQQRKVTFSTYLPTLYATVHPSIDEIFRPSLKNITKWPVIINIAN